jgi:hypothetical protein
MSLPAGRSVSGVRFKRLLPAGCGPELYAWDEDLMRRDLSSKTEVGGNMLLGSSTRNSMDAYAEESKSVIPVITLSV